MELSKLLFRPAEAGDAAQILKIIRQAQARMRAAGSLQWQDGYPSARDIEADIARGEGRVLALSDTEGHSRVIAYGAVVFAGEPAYKGIEGRWHTAKPYVVVHRLAVDDTHVGRGVAGEFIRRTGELARGRGIGGFRIDTNFDNRPMLRLLERDGFRYCGKVRYVSGERLAFDKPL